MPGYWSGSRSSFKFGCCTTSGERLWARTATSRPLALTTRDEHRYRAAGEDREGAARARETGSLAVMAAGYVTSVIGTLYTSCSPFPWLDKLRSLYAVKKSPTARITVNESMC